MESGDKILAGFVVVLAVILLFLYFNKPGEGISTGSIGPIGSAHEHPVILIAIKGQVFDLSREEYMLRAREVHLEGSDGQTIHKHATGITTGYFLQTLGMVFSNTCLITDKKEAYCNDGENKLEFYINGNKNDGFGNSEFKDGDGILILYGNETENAEILSQISF